MKASRRDKAVAKELRLVEKQEKKLEALAMNAKPPVLKTELEKHIPAKIHAGLESAFCKGFSVVFQKGKVVIEKGLRKGELQENHRVRDYAVQIKGGRKELKQMRRSAGNTSLVNLAMTTAEGIGLGILGIGIPDIVLFLGTLLKGIYETALNFGFDYEAPQERLLILKMMAASMSTGEDWIRRSREVDEMLELETLDITKELFEAQIQDTASVFAMDMLVQKFVQGIPIVGILGGAANPFFYSRVMKYVQLKYRKRYLLNQTAPGLQWQGSAGAMEMVRGHREDEF